MVKEALGVEVGEVSDVLLWSAEISQTWSHAHCLSSITNAKFSRDAFMDA